MKSRFCALFLCASLLFTALPLSGSAYGPRVIGGATATDIAAFIDWMPIESFNIDGYTYVRAEDLRGYGFDVVWNPEARTLSIAPNGGAGRASLPIEKVNIRKADIPLGRRVYDIYESDIRTDIMGEPVGAYCVDGVTLIRIDELGRFGVFSWDAQKRQVSVELARGELDDLYAKAPTGELEIEGARGLRAAYTGGVRNGAPEGAGRSHTAGNPIEWLEIEQFTYGAYQAGVRDGAFFEQDYEYECGSSYAGQWRFSRTLCRYAGGVLDGLAVKIGRSLSYPRGPEPYGYRTEQIYQNGKEAGFRRECTEDADYLYGYRVDREGYYLDGSYLDYAVDPAAAEAAYLAVDRHSALRADGRIVTWSGEYGHGSFAHVLPAQSKPAVEIDENAFGIFYRTEKGELYWLEMPEEGHSDGIERRVAAGVTEVKNGQYLTEDGTVWYWWDDRGYPIAEGIAHLTGSGYAYLDAEGTLWQYQLERYEENRPVFCGRYVLLAGVVKADGSCALRSDGSLWAWYDRAHVIDDGISSEKITTEPRKIADGAVDFAALEALVSLDWSEIYSEPSVLYLDAAGDVWALGENRRGRLGAPLETECIAAPRKVLEQMRTVALGDGNGSALGADGALWVFGEGRGVPRGFAEDGSFQDGGAPFRVTETYQKEA